jgi:hypothetical protein
MRKPQYDSAEAGRRYAAIKKTGSETERVALIDEMTANGVDWKISNRAYREANKEN